MWRELARVCIGAVLMICSAYAAEVECTSSSMAVAFNNSSFQGKIWPVNFVGSENCSLTNVSNLDYLRIRHPDWRGLAGVYDHFPTGSDISSLSCADRAAHSQANGYDMWTREFLVQNHPLLISEQDEIVTVQCIMSSSTEKISSTITARSLGDRQIMQLPVRNVVDHFMINVRTNTTQPLTSAAALTVGSTLKMVFSVTPRSHFTSLIVESCEAFERANKVGGSLQFAKKGCATPPMGVKMARSSDRRAAILTFKVFRFRSTNQIHLQCIVRGCTNDTATYCVQNCTGELEGRRKRESPEEGIVQVFEETLTLVNSVNGDDIPGGLDNFTISSTGAGRNACSCDLQTCSGSGHNPAIFTVVLATLVALPLIPAVAAAVVVRKRRQWKHDDTTQ